MASTSQTNPAYSVLAFNARDCLVCLHQEASDFLHYQSHVWLTAASSLPPGTRPAHENEREAILIFLQEERSRIRTIKVLLDAIDLNNQELIHLYEDSPVTQDEDWGAFAWGPLPQWEQIAPQE